MANPPMKSPVESIKWLDDVADHDYAAAAAYLSIKLGEDAVQKIVKKLKAASLVTRRANDVLRAAGLQPAPLSDPGVHKDLVKVLTGNALSPILVVTGSPHADIADGYHRASLVYQLDPYGAVPLKLA
jgi:hypothetical protein